MRILIATGIYPPDIGGPATYSKLLFEELPKRGIETKVLGFGEVRHLPKIVRHFVYFLKTIKAGKWADIIYAQDPVSVGLPSLVASKILGKKFILKVVGDYAWEQQQQKNNEFITPEDFQYNKFDLATELRRKTQKIVASGAEKIIVPSNYLKKIILMWGVAEEKITVINNSFESPAILENKEDLRRKLGLSGKVLISVGRLVPWKGFDVLIEAVSELVKKDDEIKLLIIGSGPEERKLKEIIKSLNLDTNVYLLGQMAHDRVVSYLIAGDIFVLNTGYEGLSHILLEAMAIGAPIITTNVGGNPELNAGVLIKYNNKEELKNTIVDLFNNKQKTQELIKKGKESISIFNKEKMFGELISVFRKYENP